MVQNPKQSFGRTLINRILNQHPSRKGAVARIKQTAELKKKKQRIQGVVMCRNDQENIQGCILLPGPGKHPEAPLVASL